MFVVVNKYVMYYYATFNHPRNRRAIFQDLQEIQ